jgi:putative ABC transport system permease protein
MLFKTNLKIAFKSIKANPINSAINLGGLSVAIASALFLLVYVQNELSFDSFHQHEDDIYRLLVSENGDYPSAIITAAIAPDAALEFPEVEAFTRITYPSEGYFSIDKKNITEKNIVYADSSLFSMFSFKLLQGDRDRALTEPGAIVISETLAHNLFGDENPIGRVISHDNNEQLTITGVVEDTPANSHITYSCFISFTSLLNKGLHLDWNGGWNYFNYIQVHPGTLPETLEAKFPAFMEKNINYMMKDDEVSYQLSLEPLTKLHLFSASDFDFATKSSLNTVLLFLSVGGLILTLAFINFSNINIIQAGSRLKEIGVRKVLGAGKMEILKQFVTEITVQLTVAVSLGLGLYSLLHPSLQQLIPELVPAVAPDIKLVSIFLAALLVPVLLISVYLALFLTRNYSMHALKGRSSRKTSPGFVNALVIGQFSVSVVLITMSLIVHQQMGFIRNKDLGFRKENLLVINLNSNKARSKVELLKSELLQENGVSLAGAASDMPGGGFTSNGYIPEGHEAPSMYHALDVDDSFLETMDLHIVNGRGFSNDYGNEKNKILINETLQRQLGWDNPIGKKIRRNGDLEVIGVVKDFHFATLHTPIAPLILTNTPYRGFSKLALKVSSTDLSNSLQGINDTWAKVMGDEMLDSYFLDQSFAAYYRKEQVLSNLLTSFAAIAIFIGAMGLFSLIYYSTHLRLKEIGIRKVIGAKVGDIVLLLSKNHLIGIGLSIVIAWPLSYWIAVGWLNSFSYHIELPVWAFIASGLAALVIGLTTLSLKTLSAARKNPVEIIRYE